MTAVATAEWELPYWREQWLPNEKMNCLLQSWIEFELAGFRGSTFPTDKSDLFYLYNGQISIFYHPIQERVLLCLIFLSNFRVCQNYSHGKQMLPMYHQQPRNPKACQCVATVYAQAEIQQEHSPSMLGENFSKFHFYWDPCLHAYILHLICLSLTFAISNKGPIC